MAASDLAGIVMMLLLGSAAFLAIVWFLLPFMASSTCASCGARQAYRAARCDVCGQAMPGPPGAHPGAGPYGFPEAAEGPEARQARIEGGVAFNRGITKRVVTLATLAMGLGIGIRLLGMVGALGLPSVPAFVDGALTIAGGVLAFVGFVFLDAA